MDLKEFIGGTIGSFSMNVKLLLVTLIVMTIHITQGADYPTDFSYNCLSDALDLYERFDSIVCQNTTSSKDPKHWLPTVCKEMCQITNNSTWCAADNGYTIRLYVTDGLRINFPGHVYATKNCQGCHNISEVIITCKLNIVTCVKNKTKTSTSSQTIKKKMTDCSHRKNIKGKCTIETSSRPNFNTTRTLTHGTTSNATCIPEVYLVLAALLGLVFGIVVILGLWLIKLKFVRSKLCVLQGSCVQNSTYNIPPRSSGTEIPKKPLTSDVYTVINKNKITKMRDDSNIYNHLHETRIDSDFNDSPYDHAQCLTETQSTPVNVLEDNYTHIHKLC